MKSIIEEHLDEFYEEAKYLQEHADFCERERQKVEKENTNLKQALNEIKQIVDKEMDECIKKSGPYVHEDTNKRYIFAKNILQIIDKVGGNE